MEHQLIYATKDEVKIFVIPGKKSQYDFRVRYREPNRRVRTPKHIHLIIDLYMKLSRNKELTLKLINHIIENIIKKISPVGKYPPELQIFKSEDISQFEELNNYGQYSIEFLLVVTELIMIQEKTNYPNGTMNLKVFESFRDKHQDIFSVVSAATFTNK